MMTFSTPNALIAAAQARGIHVGSRALREDVAVELAQLISEQVVCAFDVGGVGAASYIETSAATTARTTRDSAIAAADPRKTLPYGKR